MSNTPSNHVKNAFHALESIPPHAPVSLSAAAITPLVRFAQTHPYHSFLEIDRAATQLVKHWPADVIGWLQANGFTADEVASTWYTLITTPSIPHGGFPSFLFDLDNLRALFQLGIDIIAPLARFPEIQLDLRMDHYNAQNWRLGWENLQNVRDLDLLGDFLGLPSWIGHWNRLRSITIRLETASNSSLVIPPSIGQLHQLEWFELHNDEYPHPKKGDLQPSIEIPCEIAKCEKLQLFEIHECDLQNLPMNLQLPPNLLKLDLTQCNLQSLPDTFVPHTSLLHLILTNNFFSEIPSICHQMTSLRSITLYQNSITSLPDWLSSLTSLRSLYIDFPSLPWELEIHHLPPYVPNPITEYPALLRNTHLNFCTIGAVVRSIYNLPPNARYCMALNALRLRYLFELPPSVFAFLHDHYHTFLYTLLPAFNAKYAEERYFDFDRPIDRISRMAWIPFPNSDEDESTYVRPLADITETNYSLRMDLFHPAHHPEVVAFLEQYYADSYDTLFEHVRRGERLSENQFERFVHETTYQYWELLHNTAAKVDSRLLDALATKFSVPLSSGYSMLR